MSMRSYFVYGEGFDIEDAPASNIIMFLKNHVETITKLYPGTDTSLIDTLDPDNEDLSEYDIEEYIKANGLDDLYDITKEDGDNIFKDTVARIISNETGINFHYERGQSYDNCLGSASIILYQAPPWGFTEFEKSLTEESFSELLRPYIAELGLDVDVEKREIEYYG